MTEHEHNHEKVYKQICDYLGGDIDSPMCREVKEHLDACPECNVFFDSIKKTVTLCREDAITMKTPKDCQDKIIDLLKNQTSAE
ncbi:MAG: zf-HC2 domain-containing protein [bacterium]|nr:zf-HC2 domain-containing protein [bacterium]